MVTSARWLVALSILGCSVKTADTPSTSPPTTTEVAAESTAPKLSDDPVVNKIVELGRTQSKAHDHITHLTETIGPRLTSSHNLMAAEKWAVQRFKSFGIEARLEPWGEMPVGFDRGPWSGGQVAPKEVAYEFTTPAWTPGVHGPKQARAVLYPTSVKAAKKDPKQFADAWVVQPNWKPGEGPNRNTREKIDEALTEAGVAGVVRADRDKKGELVHTSGRSRISWDELPKLVDIRLRGDQHEELVAQLEKSVEVELSFSVDNSFFRGPVIQNNVIAEIPGAEKPEEIVIVGGHLDSWDGAQGAVDNGTGVATTLEAARLLVKAGARPKRTIRFMLWSGEEQGLLGSRAYVQKHPEEMPKISAVLVHDGGTNYLSGLWVTPEMRADMETVFAPVKKLDPEKVFELFPTEALRGGGSDHTPFINAGVPGFFWMQSGKSNYRCHHHTQLDSLDAVVPEYQQHSSMVVALAAYGIANLDNLLDRTNSEALDDRSSGVEMDGMRIKSLKPDGAAAKGGVKVGDEVVAVDGKEVKNRYRLYRAVMGGDPKKKITVKRKGRKIDLVVDYANPEIVAKKERIHKERVEKYGEEALSPPAEAVEHIGKMFGNEDSCAEH